MKVLPKFILVLFCAVQLCMGEEPRKRELFDFGWRFINEDAQVAEAPDYDDTNWQTVNLPHDFAIYGPFTRAVKNGYWNGYRPLGIGWYRKKFQTPALSGQRVRLDFEGIYRTSKIWINGTLVAESKSGYHGFEVDITSYLKPDGQSNTLAIRVDNNHPLDVTWYNGGGIYRHVWLIVSNEIGIPRHGVFITTPKITPAAATIKIQTEIANTSSVDADTTLVSEITDPNGLIVATTSSNAVVGKNAVVVLDQELAVANPMLWSPATPHLYRIASKVVIGKRTIDIVETRFGIREIRLTPNGLFLNGTREFIAGVNIHHDLGPLGVAAFDRAIERRLQLLKEMGCNGVRLSHNPNAPALLDLCDRLGLFVFNEAFCNWGRLDDNGNFARTWTPQLEEFVRRDRNHPSVFIWSVGNQVSAADRAPDFGRKDFDAMAAVVRKLDGSRPVTSALRTIRWDGNNITTKFKDGDDSQPHPLGYIWT